MSGLHVDPAVLREVSRTFGVAATAIAALAVNDPLSQAAAAVPSSRVAAACRSGAWTTMGLVAANRDSVRGYSERLAAAAHWYETRDLAAQEALTVVPGPGGGSGRR